MYFTMKNQTCQFHHLLIKYILTIKFKNLQKKKLIFLDCKNNIFTYQTFLITIDYHSLHFILFKCSSKFNRKTNHFIPTYKQIFQGRKKWKEQSYHLYHFQNWIMQKIKNSNNRKWGEKNTNNTLSFNKTFRQQFSWRSFVNRIIWAYYRKCDIQRLQIDAKAAKTRFEKRMEQVFTRINRVHIDERNIGANFRPNQPAER